MRLSAFHKNERKTRWNIDSIINRNSKSRHRIHTQLID